MSRSKKKNPCVWISKPWNKFKEHALRRKVKRALRDIEIDFDPDRDWEEANVTNKKSGEYGTRCGWLIVPNPDDTFWTTDDYEEMRRK